MRIAAPRYPAVPPATPALAAVTEASWQRTVTDALRVHGWNVFADRVAWRSDAGYPDLTAVNVKQKRVIWVELKTEKGKLSEKQQHWRDLLIEAGQEHFVWRPSDWDAAQRVMQGER